MRKKNQVVVFEFGRESLLLCGRGLAVLHLWVQYSAQRETRRKLCAGPARYTRVFARDGHVNKPLIIIIVIASLRRWTKSI